MSNNAYICSFVPNVSFAYFRYDVSRDVIVRELEKPTIVYEFDSNGMLCAFGLELNFVIFTIWLVFFSLFIIIKSDSITWNGRSI